jgi:hypothetical protein
VSVATLLPRPRPRKHTHAYAATRRVYMWGATAQDVMFGKKERKRISLRREYIGDYIGFLDNAALRTLLGAASA